MSTTSTRRPRAASDSARWAVTVVFPAPPLLLATAMRIVHPLFAHPACTVAPVHVCSQAPLHECTCAHDHSVALREQGGYAARPPRGWRDGRARPGGGYPRRPGGRRLQ